jgi:proliferating cell nuclear antigen
MADAHCNVSIKLELEGDNFAPYKFKNGKTLYLGINLSHFHKMLRSVKKKDSLSLFINDSSPTDLGIRVIPKERNRTSTSFVKIQKIQNINVDLPTGYGTPAIVPSSEFQKMCKDMAHIDKTVEVHAHGFAVKFVCGAKGVMKRVVEFGERGDSDDESDDDDTPVGVAYVQEFETEQLRRITKIAGLGTKMKVYAKDGLPLLFQSNIGELGKISLYIKSKEQIKMEQSQRYGNESEEGSDDESAEGSDDEKDD